MFNVLSNQKALYDVDLDMHYIEGRLLPESSKALGSD